MMIQRRAKAAGIKTRISCHSFRATGITTYLQNGGKLEVAQAMAGQNQREQPGFTIAATIPSPLMKSSGLCIEALEHFSRTSV
jgi:hypothetical protein